MPKAPSGLQDMGATATLEIDTEKDRDAEALYLKQIQLSRVRDLQKDLPFVPFPLNSPHSPL